MGSSGMCSEWRFVGYPTRVPRLHFSQVSLSVHRLRAMKTFFCTGGPIHALVEPKACSPQTLYCLQLQHVCKAIYAVMLVLLPQHIALLAMDG